MGRVIALPVDPLCPLKAQSEYPSRNGSCQLLNPMKAPNYLAFQHYVPHAYHSSYMNFGSAFADELGSITLPSKKSRRQKPQNP
jgi:hypothetical protein